jgi:hypothetical protein
MKKLMIVLSAATVLGLFPADKINAATQVYDLKTDWSDTQNPNGTWSYRGGTYPYSDYLLINDPFPWVDSAFVSEAIAKVATASVVPGYLELGDVFISTVTSGLTVRWTAPVNGTINIAGNIWNGSPEFLTGLQWTLTHNGSPLSGDGAQAGPRNAPYGLSSGSGGATALQNISVNAGDLIEIGYLPLFGTPCGINFTIMLTPDSVDPVAAIEALATTVVRMNLQSGIENSLDSKLDAALNALVDANENDDVAVCNSLAAFINAVEAQRGNKVTSAQADQLIAAAQEIQAMLNCGN